MERHVPTPPAPPDPDEPTAPRPPRPDPTPQEQEKLIARGTLMAIVYAEVGSYAGVAELFGVATSTVRWWVHETRKRDKDKLLKIADQLRGDIVQLAVDRVQEGLVEGNTMEAAMLGAKVLHGLGELKSHSAIKNDNLNSVTTLTLNITRADPSLPAPEVVDGAVLGVPYAIASAPVPLQSSADAD